MEDKRKHWTKEELDVIFQKLYSVPDKKMEMAKRTTGRLVLLHEAQEFDRVLVQNALIITCKKYGKRNRT